MQLSPRKRVRFLPILASQDVPEKLSDEDVESSALAEREKHVLKMCYGSAGAGMTLKQIAESMGLSRTRLVQIRDKALWDLRCRGAQPDNS